MALTTAQAIEMYLKAMGPQAQSYNFNNFRAEQVPAQQPASIPGLEKLTAYGTAKGLDALFSSAPAATSAGQIEAALANGIYQTPMSGSTLSSAAPTAATDITNFAGSATPYLGAAGAAAGAYGAYQGIKDKNPLTAGLGGLGAGLGINAMGFGLGPPGWAAMIAVPAIAALANRLGDKDQWKTEKKKLQKLQKGGTFVPEALLAQMLTRGRSKAELIRQDLAPDFVGRDAGGNWANNVFAQSRNEADLRPEDIVGYAAFAEKDKDWFNKPLDARLAEAKKALDAGAVREAKGSISVDWNKIAGALANAQ